MPNTTFSVSTADQLNAAIQQIDLNSAADAGNGTHYTIILAPGATLTEDAILAAIALTGSDTLTITGNNAILDGNNQWQGFVVSAGSVSISDLTIAHAIAQGADGANGGRGGKNGAGGGGGAGGAAGLGGGLSIAAGGSVSLSNVSFTGNKAVGGDGGAGGSATGSASGVGGTSGSGGGAGGSGNAGVNQAARTGATGGYGDGGGGGAGAASADGAAAHGGSASPGAGGTSAFGGGIGNDGRNGATATGGAGGTGGGGMGAGGDIFVAQGGNLTIISGSLSGGQAIGGAGGTGGFSLGGGIFAQGQNTITLTPGAGQFITLGDEIADQGYSDAGINLSLLINGPGTVLVTGVNHFSGLADVRQGTLEVDGAGDIYNVYVESGAKLTGTGTINAINLGNGSITAPGDNGTGILTIGNLYVYGGAIYEAQLAGTTAGTGYDQIRSDGIALGGMTLDVTTLNGFVPSGGVYEILDNTGTGAIGSQFRDTGGNLLNEGDTVMVSGVAMTISYVGGDGNDVTLTGPNPPALAITSAAVVTTDKHLTISGTIDPSDAGETISVYDGTTLLGTAVAGSGGHWSVRVSPVLTSFHSFTAQASNGAGSNTSAAVVDVIAATLSNPSLTFTVAELAAASSVLAASGIHYRVTITDTAAHIAAGIDALQANGHVQNVVLTDPGDPISITSAQASADNVVIHTISGARTLRITGFTGRPYVAEDLVYDSSGKRIGTTQENADSSIYYSVRATPSGSNTIYHYAGSSLFAGEPFDSEDVIRNGNGAKIGTTRYSGNTIYYSILKTVNNGITRYDYGGSSTLASTGYTQQSVFYNAAKVDLMTVYTRPDGQHVIKGRSNGVTLGSIHNDIMTGGGTSETFAFTAGFGTDSITDMAAHLGGGAHDTVQFTTAEFADFATMLGNTTDVSGGVQIVSGADSLTISGITRAQVMGNSASFTFVAAS